MAASLDRSAVLQKATRCLSRGEHDAALKLYLQILAHDPHDWSVGNAVGDLYVKMNRPGDAVAHFTMLAEQLVADGFAAKARALYRKIVRLQPNNDDARRRVDELDRQTAGEPSPFLKRVLETARAQRHAHAPEIAADAPPPAPAALPELPELPELPALPELPRIEHAAPPTSAPLAADRIAESFREIDAAAGAAVSRGDHRGAAAIVERFLSNHPDHVLALELLVDIGVEGAFERELFDAQHRLADACVKSGHYRQAFDIAVDLCARDPRETRHHEQLGRIVEIARAHGRTFVVPPAPDAEPEIAVEAARPRLVPPPAAATPPVAPRAIAPPPVAAPVVPAAVPAATTVQPEAPAAAVVTAAGGSIAIGPPFGDLLKEWSDPRRPEEIRNALLEDAAAAAEEGFAQSARLIEMHQFADVARPLEDAMCLPHLRVPAGAQLARVFRDSGAPFDAMAVLEWVAEMPPADEQSGHQLAYELALTLEALGEHSQALGVYRELMAEVGPSYRDVAMRVQRLAAA